VEDGVNEEAISATMMASETLRLATVALMNFREQREAIDSRLRQEESALCSAVTRAERALNEACRKAAKVP
jgi:hypothetical protein